LSLLAGGADFDGDNAPVRACQRVGDEEGIAPDFFQLVVREVWGTVGEYQVNVLVPAESAKGDAVAVVLSIGGVVSNTVTIAVR
jgi:hypothetical protein